ncbi:MAG: M1 family aminopeptidase [Acidobacteriota bacterium]
MGRALVLLLIVLAAGPARASQDPVASSDDLSIQALLQAVETAISTSDRARWLALLSATADRDQALEFFDAVVPQGVTRVVIRERDRQPLEGTLPGLGYRLLVEVFVETGPRGRIATWRLDIRRPRGTEGEDQPWLVSGQDRLSAVEGLHRLELHPEKQFAARNLEIASVDFTLRLPSGDVFFAETPEGVTALVLVGDGTLTFAPTPAEEKGQVRMFSGSDTLDTPFTAAFVRLSPWEFDRRLDPRALEPAAFDPRAARRARAIFDEDVGKSYSLDLNDLSRDTWSLLPQPGDFVAEVRTRRHDVLTYARSSSEAEDVSLFQRARRKNISVYASEQKLASRGRFYNEDDLAEYDVLDYQIETTFHPDREWIDGRARLRMRVKSYVIGALTLKLAETLVVTSVASDQFGRLMFLRVRNQNSVVVNLPSPVGRDFELTLHVTYQGRLPRQGIDQESAAVEAQQDRWVGPDIPVVAPESYWLFSNRQQWYPQSGVTDFATATLRLTVPSEYGVVGSGVPVSGTPVVVTQTAGGQPMQTLWMFQAAQPVRYLSAIVSRMSPVDASTVALDVVPPTPPRKGEPGVPAVGMRNTMQIEIAAVRRQEGRARDVFMTAAELVRFYAAIVGDVPYDALGIAMVEDKLPGGHSPGYAVMLNNPPPVTPFTWRNDPATFASFPEFFIAHEIAHQWWGQAVGWKNYHEQWLSEGFAQYFAALYARERRGESAFRDMLRQFRRTATDFAGQGPVYLGYRLGHIKSESRVFRALVYNKGAAVLHMLRRLVGDDAFFRGIRRFYAENRFRKAGTDDLQRAMEAESHRPLERFFQRWIYEDTLPRVRYQAGVEGQEVVVRFEQIGDVFDVPVTVSLNYGDRVAEEVVVLSDAVVESRLPLAGPLRGIEINADHGALGAFDRK